MFSWEIALQSALTFVAPLCATASSPDLPVAFHFTCPPLIHPACQYCHYSYLLPTPLSFPVSHSRLSCLLWKMSVLLCLISAPSPFILVTFYSSSDFFLHIPLQLKQILSFYVPNNISLFLFRKQAENSSYHPSTISLWLKNAGDN